MKNAVYLLMIGALVVGLNLPLHGATISGDTILSQRRTVEGTIRAIRQEIEQCDVFLKLDGAPETNANGTYDVIAWRKFRHERHLDGSQPGDEEGLKIRKLLAEVNEREFRLSIKKGEYIRKDLVRETWLSRAGRVTNLLRSKLEKELPPILAEKDSLHTGDFIPCDRRGACRLA